MKPSTELLFSRLDSLRHLVELNAPDPIVEMSAAMVVQSLTLFWPGLWRELGEDMQKKLRNGVGLCSECGETGIPALLTHDIECRFCDAKSIAEMRKHSVDPYEPNPPDVEEILVDLTNDECRKVNNLPDDLADGLERMLEARTETAE